MRRLGLPVVLEYEDDAFIDIAGKDGRGFISGYYFNFGERILNTASGGVGVSPHILSRFHPQHQRFFFAVWWVITF